MDSLDEAFDSIILSENKSHEKGFEDGFCHGKTIGRLEGKALGRQHGAKLGSELGFYAGFAEALEEILSESKETPRERVMKTLNSILEMVDSFPKDDPQNEKIQDSMLKIRAKFKQLSSLLNIHPSEMSESGISF